MPPRLAVLAAVLVATPLAPSATHPLHVAPPRGAEAAAGVVVLFLAFCAAEGQPLHLEWAGQAYSLSLSEVPLVVGLLCFPSPLFVVARVFGSGVALAVHRKQPPVKLAFNVAMQFFEVSVALAVFTVLPGHHAAQPLAAAPALVTAVVVASGLSMAAVCTAIRLTVGDVDRAVVWSFAATGIVAIVVNSSVAFVGVAAVRDHHALAIPLA